MVEALSNFWQTFESIESYLSGSPYNLSLYDTL
jgi:hypothetical protein